MQCDGLTKDGGVIWRRCSIDGRPGKVNAVIPLGNGFEEDIGTVLYGMCSGVR
jgi:hypothetical protein